MPGAKRSDEELVLAIPHDPAAFTEFYRRHARGLLGFLVRQGADPEHAADLTAEVFATVLLDARRFRPRRGDARAWLYAIARHKQVDAWRRGHAEAAARWRLGMREVPVYEDDVRAIERIGVDVRAWVNDLPDEQRDAVTGQVVDEVGYPELAARAGVTPATMRQRVSRGLAALRARMEER